MSDTQDYPIVLVHGIARFDYLTESLRRRLNLALWDLTLAFDRLHYFRAVASHLRQHGFTVYTPSVRFAAGVEVRAQDLKAEILRVLAQSGRDKVHIIGHSMGGLDARHMLVYEDMAARVASVTTIGTPHLGTCFAEWGLLHGGDQIIVALHQICDLEGFLTLTAEARAAFNEYARNYEATNSVRYQTYASAQQVERVFRPLQASWRIIYEQEGDNDGLVSVKSQRWVEQLVSDDGVVKPVQQHDFPMPADHLNQIGWWHLEELSGSNWWRRSIVAVKREYEAAVRNVYLQIAQDLSRNGCRA